MFPLSGPLRNYLVNFEVDFFPSKLFRSCFVVTPEIRDIHVCSHSIRRTSNRPNRWAHAMADKPTEDRILLPDEVSQILRVEVDTLYRWRLRGGGPPFIRKGRGRGRIGYRKSDVDQYILDNVRTSTSEAVA